MPMPPYPIRCLSKDCQKLAEYKIASRWSDGVTSELKTYSLCCDDCLAQAYRDSKRRLAACRMTSAESVEPPGIYQLDRGSRDKQLQRLSDLERKLDSAT